MSVEYRFHLHTECGTDPALSARIDPTRLDRETILQELERALLARHGRAARGLKVRGFTWCNGRV